MTSRDFLPTCILAVHLKCEIMKRWTIYPGDPGGVPPSAGYNPTEPHLRWLETVYPTLESDAKPLECLQRPGDIVYVPSGWIHATINMKLPPPWSPCSPPVR